MSFIDEDAVLPVGPWPKFVATLARGRTWRDDYQDAHQRLLDNGWLFADLLGDSIGSLGELYANGADEHFDVDDLPEWDFMVEAIDDTWISKRAGFGGVEWLDLAWSEMFASAPIVKDLDNYSDGLHNPLFFLVARCRFFAGMASRDLTLLWQHRIATTLEQIYQLDLPRGPVPD